MLKAFDHVLSAKNMMALEDVGREFQRGILEL